MGSAPTAAASRRTPAGIPLPDGYQTTVQIHADPDISFWERSVTPPGIDGGDEVELTTQHNSTWRTLASRSLATLTEMVLSGTYDPDVYDEILAIINYETTITVFFPDGSTLAFYGFVKRFTPGELVEGVPPECSVVIVPTNRDPADGTEQAPVMTEVAGT